MTKYELPQLPYSYDALEPYIDAMTMEIHHTKHHATYLANLMKSPKFDQSRSIEQLLEQHNDDPVIRNNGGGFYNHNLFWTMLTPHGQKAPKHELLQAIEERFTTFDKFQEEMTAAGLTQFGSGWAWLVKKDHKLEIIKKANQDAIILDGVVPILGVDVWEHAYYLKYQNRRADYLKAWWNVVNWDVCTERFLKSR